MSELDVNHDTNTTTRDHVNHARDIDNTGKTVARDVDLLWEQCAIP